MTTATQSIGPFVLSFQRDNVHGIVTNAIEHASGYATPQRTRQVHALFNNNGFHVEVLEGKNSVRVALYGESSREVTLALEGLKILTGREGTFDADAPSKDVRATKIKCDMGKFTITSNALSLRERMRLGHHTPLKVQRVTFNDVMELRASVIASGNANVLPVQTIRVVRESMYTDNGMALAEHRIATATATEYRNTAVEYVSSINNTLANRRS